MAESANAAAVYTKHGTRITIDGVAPATDARVFEVVSDAQADVYVVRHGRQTRVRIKDFSAPAEAASGGDGVVKAPMHARCWNFSRMPRGGRAGSASCGY